MENNEEKIELSKLEYEQLKNSAKIAQKVGYIDGALAIIKQFETMIETITKLKSSFETMKKDIK